MHDQDDDESIDEGVLEEVGRWRRDQAQIDAHGTPAEATDDAATLTEEEREALVARLSGRHLTAVGEAHEDEALLETGAQDASSRTMLALPRRPAALRWRLVASHGLAAGIAAAVVLAVVPRSDPGGPIAEEAPRFERVELRGTSPATHLAADDDGICLDALAQVRIEPREGDRVDTEVPLEVVIHAKPASGSPLWVVHDVDEDGSPWTRTDDRLLFEAPLSSLAQLTPGDWTLELHVGPRGACGPHALPSCRKLPNETVRVATADACHGAR